MNRLYEVPRGSAIADLINKFPEESKQTAKARAKAAEKKRELLKLASVGDPLMLMVTGIFATFVAQPLVISAQVNATISEFTHVVVNIAGEEQKTKCSRFAEFNDLLVLYVDRRNEITIQQCYCR